MTTAPETQTISRSWELPYPPAKVWRALTEPALLARWLMETDLRPEVGHSFTFRDQPTQWWDGIVNCEMLELEPGTRIRYSWRSGKGASALDTVVTWTVTATTGGTRLALEHSGFAPTNRFAFDGAGAGWEKRVTEGLIALLARAA